jgi:hypothetical protein
VETINTCKELNEQTPPPAVFDPEVIMNCLSQITEIMEEHRIIPRNLMASLRSMLAESHAAHLLVKFEREVERFDYQDGLETILIITEHMNNKLNDPAQTQRHILTP